MSMNNLGLIDRNLGKYTEAEILLSHSLDARRRVLGADHPLTLDSLAEPGAPLSGAGEVPAPAETLLLQGLEGEATRPRRGHCQDRLP